MTLLRAVRHPRYLATAWPWRALAYASTTAFAVALIWLALAAPVAALTAAGRAARAGGTVPLLAATGLGLLGLGLLALGGPRVAVAMAGFERGRLRLADSAPVPAPASRRAGHWTDVVTWRAVAYAVLLALIAPVWLGVLAAAGLLVAGTPIAMHHRLVTADSAANVLGRLALGLVLIPVLLYLGGVLGGAHAALARLLLAGEPDPAVAELAEVTRSRARLADAFEAERHRIERDLHDVAQQRLVSLTMQLGLARHELDRHELSGDSPAAQAVAAAHQQAKTLMVELRELVRGISPRTLRELGLRDAIEELAAAGPLPMRVTAAPGRFPPAVETVAFAVVSEAVANVSKHAGATECRVVVRRDGRLLTAEVRDDGGGGADPAGGSGLTGLADRAAAAGGRLLLSSPVGGPTIVRVELPCGS
ncbi:histidine kinase [Actinoplanes sp. NPDC026619]|uniref:sensor histidine kinase n=1 Tax=Actinoplanes sp. NPDC026619 TaxID=3155798 RepID=UPI0034076601